MVLVADEWINKKLGMNIKDLLNANNQPVADAASWMHQDCQVFPAASCQNHNLHSPPLTPIAALKAPRKRIGSPQAVTLQRLFSSGVHFPDRQLRAVLSQQLGLSGRSVQVWFQNRRQQMKSEAMKQRRESEEDIAKLLQSIKHQL